MTMKYGTVGDGFLTAGLLVRAYAQLSDGTYVYSDVQSGSVYGVADHLYQNHLMSSAASHNYLYDRILHRTNSEYQSIVF